MWVQEVPVERGAKTPKKDNLLEEPMVEFSLPGTPLPLFEYL